MYMLPLHDTSHLKNKKDSICSHPFPTLSFKDRFKRKYNVAIA